MDGIAHDYYKSWTEFNVYFIFANISGLWDKYHNTIAVEGWRMLKSGKVEVWGLLKWGAAIFGDWPDATPLSVLQNLDVCSSVLDSNRPGLLAIIMSNILELNNEWNASMIWSKFQPFFPGGNRSCVGAEPPEAVRQRVAAGCALFFGTLTE